MNFLYRKQIRAAYRRLTWRLRALPDFLIIGAQKSGSSSLYHYLRQHPGLLPSFNKEVSYFDGGIDPNIDNYDKGIAWYRSYFPFSDDSKLAFEATPLYLWHPLAPARIHDTLPDIKLIAVLRNPTERAISNYFHERRKGWESLSIVDALHAEEDRLAEALRTENYRDHAFSHFPYKLRGLYHIQIERYLEHFPANRMYIMSSEDMFADPKKCISDVLNFLGLEMSDKIRNLQPRNVSSNRENVPSEVYEYLDRYYAEPNEALYSLLGKRFDW